MMLYEIMQTQPSYSLDKQAVNSLDALTALLITKLDTQLSLVYWTARCSKLGYTPSPLP